MAKKAKKTKTTEEPQPRGRPEPEAKEFRAKIVAILPQINRSNTKKGRVRGQDKWGFMLEKESGQQTALWGHWMRPFSEAGIGKLKAGDTLLITVKNHREWGWEPVRAKAKVDGKKAKKRKK